ncbi:MAG: hypothetical protein RLZZ543_376, partial [Bacteroidota bacterium]
MKEIDFKTIESLLKNQIDATNI